ncbi:hypothetical protein [Pyxidicoccus sp. MSG2]|uniref:hypothetical protein n=1 Tax=Pyxidicoccus sp. MSG2 TaxID=2996790 RepID=UPI00226F8F3A|nr:hypothetical protein [Pyxidicoccus sp. MSG2]MCY1021978.1 hypothetical protein [Pyxidicoccus sp. MSG2]
MAKARWTWLLVAALVGLGACKDHGTDEEGTDGGDVDAEAQAGFGKDRRQPKGTPLSLPAGVQVSGTIVGADDDGNCGQPQTADVGSGLYVRACLKLTNISGGPVQVTFPPGLVIVSASEGYQNGLLVERVVITVPPTSGGPGGLDGGSNPETVNVPLHFYCINKASDPSDPAARYELGPITDHPQMRELYTLLQGKDVYEDGLKVEVVQEAVYSISDGSGLTADDRAALRNL